ncbi:hypothetical protein [Nocardia sp. R7R-8]|uniref:hypothetical protein n=1 Tax=Nocardia sp. R7R-8 TaxID=3459304 RepID=UPI00403D8662
MRFGAFDATPDSTARIRIALTPGVQRFEYFRLLERIAAGESPMTDLAAARSRFRTSCGAGGNPMPLEAVAASRPPEQDESTDAPPPLSGDGRHPRSTGDQLHDCFVSISRLPENFRHSAGIDRNSVCHWREILAIRTDCAAHRDMIAHTLGGRGKS